MKKVLSLLALVLAANTTFCTTEQKVNLTSEEKTECCVSEKEACEILEKLIAVMEEVEVTEEETLSENIS